MTTNHMEHLDGALIRPERVDKKIEFRLADAEVVRKLLCTVFEQSEEELPDVGSREKRNEEVRQLAVQFAGVLPELEFSPAEILSFLLIDRVSPSSALAAKTINRNRQVSPGALCFERSTKDLRALMRYWPIRMLPPEVG